MSLVRTLRLILLVLGGIAVAFASARAENQKFQSLWHDATADADCTKAEYADFILVTCDKTFTFWYFTKPNHPAHPGVIKRTLTQESDGSWYAREHGYSFASDEAQPEFKAWLAQIADLDRQMADYAKQHAPERSQPPSPH